MKPQSIAHLFFHCDESANENQTVLIVLLVIAFFFFQGKILLLVSITVFNSSAGFLTLDTQIKNCCFRSS
jgi:hypothetical protein